MNIGTKSLLFGVHQFAIHPLQVFAAWLLYYKRFPRLHQLCAIVTHDWGYWGSPNMDGEEGGNHPERAALMWRHFGNFGLKVQWEIVGHSGSYASKVHVPISKLFKADKLCVVFLPCFVYVFLASLSGEINEYMRISNGGNECSLSMKSKMIWFFQTTDRILERVYE